MIIAESAYLDAFGQDLRLHFAYCKLKSGDKFFMEYYHQIEMLQFANCTLATANFPHLARKRCFL
jgi:hypothetical protein